MNPRPAANRTQLLSRADGGGNHIYNEILLELPRNEFGVVLPKLELVRLQPRQVLHEAGDTLKSAYFCNTGLISILSVLSDGRPWKWECWAKRGWWGCR